MRKSITVALGVLLAGTLVLAQSHDNATEKSAKDIVTFGSDTRVGTVVLIAGEYKVVCDTNTITFTRLIAGSKDQEQKDLLDPMSRAQQVSNVKALEVPCKGAHLNEKVKTTVAQIAVDKNGVKFLEKLLLRGSNVEHVFN
jgi:hypothetical protein